ncbi:MAG TPA: cytochrome b [Thermomonas sp.]|jgi:cytochrome b561|uniref:cytochrome b n=1 Tax=Thermomonas sp. TaxID=1971895 RepID=UPI002BEEECF9|nr:cytochrome b [Thermomonas sp.]HOV95934.1 cytochrome b [Thermomonas sp.]
MPIKNTTTAWGAISQLLHWLTLALLLTLAWIGLRMGNMPNGPDKIATYATHKSLGLTLLALVLLRIGWRLYAGSPADLRSTPAWQARIAHFTHLALYALLLAMPLSGWLLNSAAGFPLQWFGVFNLPPLSGQNDALHALAVQTHEVLFWTLAVLVLVHAAAAIQHHVFTGDATLARMLPRGWLAPPTEHPDA